jgi:hypothetical protein
LAAPILKELDRLRNAISGAALQIGEQLKKLHGIYAPERFSVFMRRDLPQDHGISRSTGYRWMASAEKLSLVFPNSVVRDELMLRTDARGIFVDPGKDCNHHDLDPAHAALSPAAQEALSTLSAPPDEEDEYKSRQWARTFIKTMNKARARQRAREAAARRTPEREQEAILLKLKKFAENFGADVASHLRAKVNRILDAPKQNGKSASNAPAPQAQGVTESLSIATPREQAQAFEQSPSSLSQTEAKPSSISDNSQSQSPFQSQLGTEAAAPEARAKKRTKKRMRVPSLPQTGSGYAGYLRKILTKR